MLKTLTSPVLKPYEAPETNVRAVALRMSLLLASDYETNQPGKDDDEEEFGY